MSAFCDPAGFQKFLPFCSLVLEFIWNTQVLDVHIVFTIAYHLHFS